MQMLPMSGLKRISLNMSDRRLILLTGSEGFFGQTRKPWVSMNVEKMQAMLEEHGFRVERYAFHVIANHERSITDSLIFYSFSQKPNRRRYITDLIRYLDDGTNTLIPSYDLLLCHENKGFQELYKRKINLGGLRTYYLTRKEELQHCDIGFPVVFKTREGSNAKGVFLARNQRELLRLIERNTPQRLLTMIDLLRRKYFRRRKHYKEYPDYSNRTDYHQYRDYVRNDASFLLQEFVPDLQFDYRVLVLYDKYYVTKRHIPEGDFRASGAKRFDFDFEPDPSLLDFVRDIYHKFDTPFLSVDIGAHESSYYLFEFQALHFGLNVFVKSNGYYVHRNGRWDFVEATPDIETELAIALARYVSARRGESGG